jgi:hypothetical protein
MSTEEYPCASPSQQFLEWQFDVEQTAVQPNVMNRKATRLPKIVDVTAVGISEFAGGGYH